MSRFFQLTFSLMAILAATHAVAQEESPWAFCPPVSLGFLEEGELERRPDSATVVTADRFEVVDENTSVFSGNVLLQREDKRLRAEWAEYNRSTDTVELTGEVRYRTEEIYLESDRARFDLGQERGELEDGFFHLSEIHAFGRASHIRLSDPEHMRLKEVSYSTCSPERQDWLLTAGRLELDQATNTGEARNVTLRFKGVPFLYAPYINFPLKGRKSGLLPPTFERSDTNGTDLALPIYWNIAPNQDATLTLRNLTARGPMAMGEYRFLAEESAGQINADYLPDDKLTGEDRWFASTEVGGRLVGGWRGRLNYAEVSDPDYFNDLGTSISVAGQTHLEQALHLTYHGEGWDFLGRLQQYQTLSGIEPYRRLPQLRFTAGGPPVPGRLHYDFSAEAVRFAHEQDLPTGTRLDFYPAVSYPMEGIAWFLTPRLALRHTQYSLDNVATAEQPERTLPLASLDTGLFFERELQWGDRALEQTLEPRLFYLYVPFQDQDNLPVFDTGRYDFSFAQLFREDRFNGADRVGDANQLSFALTSRILDTADGRELLRGSFGQIYYFDERKVTLTTAEPPEESDSSDLIAELAGSPTAALDLSAAARWDPQEERDELLTSRVRYRPAPHKVVSAAYRFRRDQALRQTDLALYWPLARQWRFLGRWNYDLENERSLEGVGGLEYQSCCWTLRAVARARYKSATDETEHSLFLALELKGLGSLGRPLESELERGILGYD